MNTPLIITISRQLGSGGEYIGQQLTERLKIQYIDRRLISEVAKELSVPEEEVAAREEQIQSLWKAFTQSCSFNSNRDIPAFLKYPPTDYQLFIAESDIIKKIAKEGSAVIIGRCGFHVLEARPDLVRIFLYADREIRAKRVAADYSVNLKEASKMIVESDRKRGHYIEAFTKKIWTDAAVYDLSINTGKLGLEKTIDLILNYLKELELNKIKKENKQ